MPSQAHTNRIIQGNKTIVLCKLIINYVNFLSGSCSGKIPYIYTTSIVCNVYPFPYYMGLYVCLMYCIVSSVANLCNRDSQHAIAMALHMLSAQAPACFSY